jgi:hypothetical protein
VALEDSASWIALPMRPRRSRQQFPLQCKCGLVVEARILRRDVDNNALGRMRDDLAELGEWNPRETYIVHLAKAPPPPRSHQHEPGQLAYSVEDFLARHGV